MNRPETKKKPIAIGSCLLGAMVASGIAYPLYLLTRAIAETYARKPVESSQRLAIAISTAVRTLVMGGCTLATGIFAMAAIGLLLLAAIGVGQKWQRSPSSD